MNVHDAQILAQLVDALDESVKKLELGYEKKDVVKVNEAKKAVLDFQRQIKRIIG